MNGGYIGRIQMVIGQILLQRRIGVPANEPYETKTATNKNTNRILLNSDKNVQECDATKVQ